MGLSAGTKPWRRTSWSSSASGRRRCLGGEERWRPDKAVRRAAHPAMRVVRPPVAAGQSRRLSSSALLVSVVIVIVGIVASLCPCVIVVVVAGPHNLHCRHRPCLRHRSSRCCCRQCRRCSPTLMVGCCVAYSVVCRPICHPQISSSCDHQHFRRRPPAAGGRPLSPTFTSRCPIHHLCHSCRWLVVAFSAHPAAYQLNYKAENVFMFPHLDLL